MRFTIPGTKNKKVEFELREDRAILMFCIGIALVFWVLVKLSQDDYRVSKAVDIEFNIPDNLTFSEAPPNDLQVQIKGVGWDLMFDYFANRRVELYYDLLHADRLNLTLGQLRTDILNRLSSNNLQITEVNYDNINLNLEEKVTWKVPLILQSRFSFSPEYDLEKPVTLEPDSLEITGPASMLDQIDFWETDSLVLTDLKTSQEVDVGLALPPRELTLSARQVKAKVTVEQFTEKSIFVPLTVKNAPDSIKIFPANVQVRCIVGLTRYDSLTAQVFELVLDLKDVPVSESKTTAPIRLARQPEYVQLLNFSPKSAEFFILK